MNIIQVLYISLIVLSVFLILFGLLKETSSDEALASISGGSQQLFVQKKTEFVGSIVFRINLFLVVINVVLVILLKVFTTI